MNETKNDCEYRVLVEQQNEEQESIIHNEPQPQSSNEDSSFLKHFVSRPGPLQIFWLCLLLALSFGSILTVVPAVMTNRFAHDLHHDFDGDCSQQQELKPQEECIEGSNHAQNASALSSFISYTLTFISSPLIGSLSDKRGRKGFLMLALGLSMLQPLSLLWIQMNSNASPWWYYSMNSMGGLVSFLALSLSSLADVLSSHHLTAGFGVTFSGFFLGFALSPCMTFVMNNLHSTMASTGFLGMAWIVGMVWLPETLPPPSPQQAALLWEDEEAHFSSSSAAHNDNHHSNADNMSLGILLLQSLSRPFKELSILNRSKLFRLLAVLAFLSGVTSSGTIALFPYYAETQLGLSPQDLSLVFCLSGILGIVVQACLLKPLVTVLGERGVLVVSFMFGSFHTLLYGIASHKATIYISACIGSFAVMSAPTIAAIKSNNVSPTEQGRIQGALYSVQALASAVGPAILRLVQRSVVQHNKGLFPGPMFIFSAGLYLVACMFSLTLPNQVVVDSRGGGMVMVVEPTTVQGMVEEEKNEDKAQIVFI